MDAPFEKGQPGIPPARVSMAEYTEYHLILDQELSQLSHGEAGVLGSTGFTALGGFLGLIPGALAGWQKAIQHDPALTALDLSSTLVCACCLVASVTCLSLFALWKRQNKGLVAGIRVRPKVTRDQLT